VAERPTRPAFYAARSGGWRDWWTLLHPPYTAWHLSYVVIGASLAPRVDTGRLVATLLAYEHSLVKADDLSKLDAAFFAMNGYISMSFLLFWGAAVALWRV